MLAKSEDFIEKAASTKGGSTTNAVVAVTDKLKPKGNADKNGPITATSHPHKDLSFRASLCGVTRTMGSLNAILGVKDSAEHTMIQENLEMHRKLQSSEKMIETYLATIDKEIHGDDNLGGAQSGSQLPTMAVLQGGSK